MAWGDDAGSRRASDADRERTVEVLRSAAGRGSIELHELEERLGRTYTARTLGQLAAVIWDLEPVATKTAKAAKAAANTTATLAGQRTAEVRRTLFQNASFRFHATTYGLTNSMLVGIWALNGVGHFWPFYPAAGWGIGLGLHAMTTHSAETRRSQRGTKLLETRASSSSKGPAADLARPAIRELDDGRRRASSHNPEGGRHREDRHGRHGASAGRKNPAPAPATGQTSAPTGQTSAPTGQRRFVVVMFIDIVGSTRLTEVLGDEGWAQLRSAHRELLRSCFAAAGGSEVSAQGDGFLARFALPVAAVRCAIDVQSKLEAQRRATGFAPHVRIGIHSGEVVDTDGDLLGRVVNLAARVVGAAEPDEIFITEPVADHLDPDLALDDRGLHSLRGVTGPRHLLAVPWA